MSYKPKTAAEYIVYISCILILAAIGLTIKWAFDEEAKKVETKPTVEAVPVDPTATTRDFADKVMTRCKATLSQGRREILIGQLVRVVHQRFDKEENRQAFMALVCIESGFNPNAKSPVGAVGLSQVMPAYATEFAKLCGLGPVTADDLGDAETNLTLGACYFNHLLTTLGNSYLAIASYNGGPASAAVKNLRSLKGGGNEETTNYINKVGYLKEEILNDKTVFVLRASANK